MLSSQLQKVCREEQNLMGNPCYHPTVISEMEGKTYQCSFHQA